MLALEAVPAAAAVFQKSVEWNNLSDVIQAGALGHFHANDKSTVAECYSMLLLCCQVVNVAAGHQRGTVSLQAKPMSSNSFTVAEARVGKAARGGMWCKFDFGKH